MLFGSITREPLDLSKFDATFEFPGQYTKYTCIIFQRDVDTFEIRAQNMSI